jgi:hypothetical protein
MAKDKKKNKKQNKSEVKQAPPITLSGEDLQHLIAHAIIEADEIKEEALYKQQDAELLEWRAATGYKEFSDKSIFLRSVKTFFNRFWCFIKLCFVPSKAIKGDRASFALMKLFLRIFFDFAKWILGLSSLMFILYGIVLFFAPETMPVLWISNIGLIILGITVFFLSRMFRMASIEIEKIEDRNYLFGLFASVASIVSIVIAIIAVVKGG